jgi:hypothetical protein
MVGRKHKLWGTALELLQKIQLSSLDLFYARHTVKDKSFYSRRRMHSQGHVLARFLVQITHSNDGSSSSHANLCQETRGSSSSGSHGLGLLVVVLFDAVHFDYWNVAAGKLCVMRDDDDWKKVMGGELNLSLEESGKNGKVLPQHQRMT